MTASLPPKSINDLAVFDLNENTEGYSLLPFIAKHGFPWAFLCQALNTEVSMKKE